MTDTITEGAHAPAFAPGRAAPTRVLVAALGVLSLWSVNGAARAEGPGPISAVPPADTMPASTSTEEELRRRLATAEQRIKDLERQLQERDRTASLAPASVTSGGGSLPSAPFAAFPPASPLPPGPATTGNAKVAQGAGLPPLPAPAPGAYNALDALEEKLPPWFPKLLGGQWNIINQKQFPFHSQFSGPNSVNPGGDDKTSQTRGVYMGSQVTDDLQAYLDLEWFVGNCIHGGTGLGGYPNGDVVRSGPANLPKDPYLARAYVRYLVPLSAETALVPRSQDQLPGHEPTEYLFVKAGHLAVTDDFDTNRYANSVRTQFMNYALINNGSYDYAADTRGYTNGLTLGWVTPDWTLKLASYQVPKVGNGEDLDFEISRAQGSQAEFAVKPFGNDTVVRFLAFANQARMGNYDEAVQIAQATGTTPSVQADDKVGRWKYGFGLNMEIPLADNGNTGLFFRAGWNDGRTETWMFTEIDRSLSVGGQLMGSHWGRDDDWVGLGVAVNGLSSQHKAYLAAGGSGFMIGDGALPHYKPETIVETYYNFTLINPYLRLGPDYQFIANPAYNGDRGPVHVASIRARGSF
ncbi:MAG: carbohydrate porin [Alphaproteobacteria bacterium]|nr:carbohydrate porin [Alphaproteobacteria bacterium]